MSRIALAICVLSLLMTASCAPRGTDFLECGPEPGGYTARSDQETIFKP